MAEILSSLAEAFATSSFYTEYCRKLPGGLSNAYLDVLILLIFILIGISLLFARLGAIRRQREFQRVLLHSRERDGGLRLSEKDYYAYMRWKEGSEQEYEWGSKADGGERYEESRKPEEVDENVKAEAKTGNPSERARFDVDALIRRKKEEEASLKQEEDSAWNKLSASIEQVKEQKVMGERIKEMDEESRQLYQKNLNLLQKKVEDKLTVDAGEL